MGLSLSQFARECRLSKAYTSMIETGKCNPPMGRPIDRLCRVLGVTPFDLHFLAYLDRAPRMVEKEENFVKFKGRFFSKFDLIYFKEQDNGNGASTGR